MKRVCHVTSLHPVFDARIFYKECMSLSKKYEVYLIAPNVEDKVIDDIHIKGVHLPESRIKRFLKLNDLYEKMREIDADLYHFHDPELIGIATKIRKSNKKIIFDSHEDVPKQILNKPWIPKYLRYPISLLYSCYENKYLKKFDGLISVTPTIVERLKSINNSTYLITNFPIYVEREKPHLWENQICFTGLLSPKWMLGSIVNSIKDMDVKFVVAGLDRKGDYINNLLSMKGGEKIQYRGVVKKEEVYDIHRHCFAGLAIESFSSPNANYKKGSLGMTKALEYMMSGIPVIISDTEIWGEIVRKQNCGICVNPDSEEEIKEAILFYYKNKEIAKQHGENGKTAVRNHYNWSSQEEVLLQMYEDIID